MLPVDLIAPPHWRQVDFISDIHLQSSEPDTYAAWVRFMQGTSADALFILGDLFEIWVGDDVLDDQNSFESACTNTIRLTASRIPVFILHGNRDFLMGSRFAQASHAILLNDPTILQINEKRIALSHGDALCLDDRDYQDFRKIVRSDAWQKDFLSKPLPERQQIAAHIRTHSEAQKISSTDYADADSIAALSLLESSAANTMVHGHTHRPATHSLAGGKLRWVLSDWHIHGMHTRAEVLRLQSSPSASTPEFHRLSPAACCPRY